MNLRQVVSINGMPGLYELLATKSDGAIVRNVEDKSTKFVGARQHSVSALDGIEVYTTGENMLLIDVFMEMKKNSNEKENIEVNKLDNKQVQEEFGRLFPQYDHDRVYVSDMKKMLKWFLILNRADLLNTQEEAVETHETTEAAPEPQEMKSKKESKAPDTEAEATTEEKPKKTRKPKEEKKDNLENES
jgi:hypothetical protein